MVRIFLTCLIGLIVLAGTLGCSPKNEVRQIQLGQEFTTRLGQYHITPDEDFVFKVSKIVMDIQNDAMNITDLQLEYSSAPEGGKTEIRNTRVFDHFGPYSMKIETIRPIFWPIRNHNKYRFKVKVSRNNFLSVDCSAFYFRIEDEEFLNHENCGIIDKYGMIRLNKDTVDRIDFNVSATSSHPARLWCLPIELSNGEKFHAYINEKGIAREAVNHHDIACGGFSENGLAQTHIKGKVAFFNSDLNVVQRTPFKLIEGDIGCIEMPEKHYPTTSEHHEWRGGDCYKIDSEFQPKGYRFEQVSTSNQDSDD